MESVGRLLWQQKWTMTFGLLVAVAAAVFSGYRLDGGQFVERVTPEYVSNVRLLVSDLPVYQSQDVKTLDEGQQIVRGLSAAQLAGTYPYMITSEEMLAKVASRVSVGRDGYEIDAHRRTVAPGASQNVSLAGDNSLPIVEVTVRAHSAPVAREVAQATALTFTETIREQQDAAALPPDQRTAITALDGPSQPENVGDSALALQLLVFGGTMLVFFTLVISRRRDEDSSDHPLQTVRGDDRMVVASNGVPAKAADVTSPLVESAVDVRAGDSLLR